MSPSNIDLEIARRFLSGVVVIDDLAQFDADGTRALLGQGNESEAVSLAEDPSGSGLQSDPLTLITTPQPGLETPPLPDTHALSASEVVEAFSAAGMICTILKPPTHAAFEEVAKHAVRRADAVVLDWVLLQGESPGVTARRIVSMLLDSKLQPVRLICIYTGDPGVNEIAASLADEFEGELVSNFEVNVSGTKISVLAKDGNTYAPARQVQFSDLAERVVWEFAGLATGLIPGFAIAALGALRENSAPILRRLSSAMDAALLGHRISLADPAESCRPLREALTDELNSIVTGDYLVAESLSLPQILARSRMTRRSPDDLKACDSRFNQSADLELDRLLKVGGGQKLAGARWPSQVHSANDQDAYDADLWFAELLQARSFYGPDPPTLQLGVVVRSSEDDGYLLCVQPPCDSVRMKLGEERRFPFLPLGIANGVDAQFVVDDGGCPVPLHGEMKLYRTVQIRFVSNNDVAGSVDAVRIEDRWYFGGVEKTIRYAFVTRLREGFGQRVAQVLGSDGSRIGVDDPEWIRAKRKTDGSPATLVPD